MVRVFTCEIYKKAWKIENVWRELWNLYYFVRKEKFSSPRFLNAALPSNSSVWLLRWSFGQLLPSKCPRRRTRKARKNKMKRRKHWKRRLWILPGILVPQTIGKRSYIWFRYDIWPSSWRGETTLNNENKYLMELSFLIEVNFKEVFKNNLMFLNSLFQILTLKSHKQNST